MSLGAAARGALQLAKRIELAGRSIRALVARRVLIAPLTLRGPASAARRIWLVDPPRSADRSEGAAKQDQQSSGPAAALIELSRLSRLGRTLALLVQRALLLPGSEPRSRRSNRVAPVPAAARTLSAAAERPTRDRGPVPSPRPRRALEGFAPPVAGADAAPPHGLRAGAPLRAPGVLHPAPPEAKFSAARRARPHATDTASDAPPGRPRRLRSHFAPDPHPAPRSAPSSLAAVLAPATVRPGPAHRPERIGAGVPPGAPARDEPLVEAGQSGQNLRNRFSLPERLRAAGLGWLERTAEPVRLHTDGQADRKAQSLRADAVTLGHDIYFRYDKFDPGSPRGMALIAHELVHVAQQGAMVQAGALVPQRLEAEAERTEHRVYRLLAEPAIRSVAGPGPRYERSAVPGDWHVPQGRPAAGAPPRAAIGASAAVVPLPAAEGRAAPGGAEPGPDPHEIAAQVCRLLDRKLRIDRERLGLGRL